MKEIELGKHFLGIFLMNKSPFLNRVKVLGFRQILSIRQRAYLVSQQHIKSTYEGQIGLVKQAEL